MPRRQSAKTRRTVVIVCSVLCTGLVLMVIGFQGHVTGTEFAPSHFQSRDFSFYEIPGLQLQISPITRTGTTAGVATSIRLSGLIQTPKGPPTQWHVVSLSRGMTGTTPDDAHLLTEQLEMLHDGTSFWKTWNTDHPQHAAVLWPMVQRLAQRELYVLIPELLLIARSSAENDTPQTLRKKIDQTLIREYRSLIADMRQSDRPDLADAFDQELRADYPDLPRAEPTVIQREESTKQESATDNSVK
ncbi:hypothetical protein [Stieleria varia]|uniref:Uncharacterized protein n=1 Tax=Stieleria varia TaxID=2528005 RepID=A0A5C5ZYE6_9BACT|nr:hypothetical protein [Stieleria varia]TWT92682.1 hypothetical protein Pla52n_60470 [Stieleria varia]